MSKDFYHVKGPYKYDCFEDYANDELLNIFESLESRLLELLNHIVMHDPLNMREQSKQHLSEILEDKINYFKEKIIHRMPRLNAGRPMLNLNETIAQHD